MTIFSHSEASLNHSQIEEVEKFVGLNFPTEYKEHLLEYNGGQCVPNVFSFYENGEITDSSIDWFLAIYDGEYDNLKNYIENYKIKKKRLPFHILPIAHDPGGNLICISCGNDDIGNIYFWDHEKEVNYGLANDQDYSNLYLIAENFKEFINGFKESIE
jgi:hypothetical protein